MSEDTGDSVDSAFEIELRVREDNEHGIVSEVQSVRVEGEPSTVLVEHIDSKLPVDLDEHTTVDLGDKGTFGVDQKRYEKDLYKEETPAELVKATELFPHPMMEQIHVPLFEDHPPDFPLPMLRCHNCGVGSVSLLKLWDLHKRREELVTDLNEMGYEGEMRSRYIEEIEHISRHISRLLGSMSLKLKTWVSDQVDPRSWDESELNPSNIDGNSGGDE